MVNWDDEDILEWKAEAQEVQQEFYERLGDREWDHFRSDERWMLEKKIGFALFGYPTEESNEDNKYGYNKQSTEEIVKFATLLREHNGEDEFYIAFLFAYAKEHDDRLFVPIFRLKTPRGIKYIDKYGRVYKDWTDFEENNTLPKCLLCYPESGYYHACGDKVSLKFDSSPACKLGARTVSKHDVTATVVTIGAVVTGIASLAIPGIGPIALAAAQFGIAAEMYSRIRGSQHDRRIHKESVSLNDKDARNSWLSITGGCFGLGSGLAVKSIMRSAASGEAIGKANQTAANIMISGLLDVNGFGIMYEMISLAEKCEKNELTKFDLFQFATSVFFFTNTVVSTKTAEEIIRDVQDKLLKDFRSDLTNKRSTVMKKVGGTQQRKENVIRGFMNAETVDEFYRMVLDVQKISKASTSYQNGKLGVNGALFTNIMKGLVSTFQNIILSITKIKFVSKSVSLTEVKAYKDIFSNIKNYVITINENIQFKFEDIVQEEFSNLCCKYSIAPDKECISDLLNKTENFAKEKGCKGETDFNDFAEFLMIHKKIQLKNKRSMFEQQMTKMKEETGENFDETTFYKKWKIDDPDCVDISLQKLVDEEFKEEDLREKYDSLNEQVTAINQDGNVKFISNLKAINNYYRTYSDLDCDLAAGDFFRVIREVVRNEIYKLHSENPNTVEKHLAVCENEEILITVETWVQDNEIFLHSVHFATIANLFET